MLFDARSIRVIQWIVGTLCVTALVGWAFDAQSIEQSERFATSNTTRDAFGQPLPELPENLRDSFVRGRSLFRQNWVIAPANDAAVDGLGPLHNRISCIACHTANGKGHAPNGPTERASSLLVRLSVPGHDQSGGPKPHPIYGDQFNEDSIPNVPAEGRVIVSWRMHRVSLADGENVFLREPIIQFAGLAYGPLNDVQISARIGSAVFGLGLLEAVPVAVLEEMVREKKVDGVTGKLNAVYDPELASASAGRFGLKANRSSLRDQIAAAMAGDLGITSSIIAQDGCMPAQIACKGAADGGSPELDDQQLKDLQTYLTFLAPPARRNVRGQQIKNGAQLFTSMGCATCHRPQLPLGKHSLLGDLTGSTIAPYTDLLLHNMGSGLADKRPDYLANGKEWRTAPLWGAGLQKLMNERVGYLHDGRARNVQEAILWHGGEAKASQQRYVKLSKKERQALLAFIDSL